MTNEQHYKRSPNVLQRRLGNESLLVPVKGNLADMQTVFSLNPTGETLWQALEQPRDTDGLVRELIAAFKVDEPTARRDVEVFVAALAARGLIESISKK